MFVFHIDSIVDIITNSSSAGRAIKHDSIIEFITYNKIK